MTDEFGAPAGQRGGRNYGSNYVDSAGIERDRWDRPQLPHPDTGVVQPWTRVSTLAKTLDDTYALEQWRLRQAIHGMSKRHDLFTLAASTPNDDEHKGELQKIADTAIETAESSRGANLGTSLHRFAHTLDMCTTDTDRARVIASAPPPFNRDLEVYRSTLNAYQLTSDPRYMERMTVCPEVNAAGSFDRLLLCGDGKWRVADLKTQKDPPDMYTALSIGVQLSTYANGRGLWNVQHKVYETFPDNMDRTLGIVIWLPAGQAHCELFWVNLTRGAELAALSDHVRTIRKDAKSLLVPVGPPAPRADIHPIALDTPEVHAAVESLSDASLILDGTLTGPPTTEQIKAAGTAALDSLAELTAATGGKGQAAVTMEEDVAKRRAELILERIQTAASTVDLTNMHSAYQAEGFWTPEMRRAAGKRWEELSNPAGNPA